ncbi:uncharacterized protein LOC110834898 isoform X2 [Zootermopsis nevadensis]|nr:uncharacterized protein LOC110834898 isoform X2 [Zootermopsis nevadensis]
MKFTELDQFTHVSGSVGPSDQASIPKPQQPVIQLVKTKHPCRTTFIPEDICCLFSQDSFSIQDFGIPRTKFTDRLCSLSSHELHERICRHELKFQFPFLSDAVLHPLCRYLFLLMSVHRDERTVFACSNTLRYIKRGWCPSLDIILIVFINWGINQELLDTCDIDVGSYFPVNLFDKVVSSPRFEDTNVQKVLEFIHSVAATLGKESAQDKLNKVVQVLVLSALDGGFKSPTLETCFSRCIRALLDGIPESQWNKRRVWTICEMLHRNGAEHFHNQAVVCCSLLIVSPRSIEIAKALTLTTLNHLLATELKTEPLGNIADSNITELVMHYPLIDELGPYELYTVVRLVDLCVLRAYTEDNLNLENLNIMISWLRNLSGRISTSVELIDTHVVKELITRCLSSWQTVKFDIEFIKLVDGDAASLVSDGNME